MRHHNDIFRIAKIVPFRYPRWTPHTHTTQRPSWNSSSDISHLPRWPPWHNVTYHDLPNPGERFLAHVGLSFISKSLVFLCETWRFRTAKFVPFQHQRWSPGWEALERPGDSNLLNHFVTISTMAVTAAILKIFSCLLMPWSVDHGHLSSVCLSATFHIFDISIRNTSMMSAMAVILKVFSCHLLQNDKSD